jgi:hypothetical protein
MPNRLNNLALETYTERFRRPSKYCPLNNPYSFKDFKKDTDTSPLITTVFDNNSDVIMAYFGILSNASNMEGFLGGCGSIGNSLQPYAYAYELFTPKTQKKMSLSEFMNSYQGIGHITLLKLNQAYTPYNTTDSICYYMFETESITGPSHPDIVGSKRGGSYFVYQYGIITVKNSFESGWKIESIDSLSEDFLCAPEHGWVYLSEYLVTFVYKDWYHIINQIDDTKQCSDMIFIYASSLHTKYRFDFIRLTNGYDILLHENICIEGTWCETNLLKTQDQRMKLSILNPNLK